MAYQPVRIPNPQVGPQALRQALRAKPKPSQYAWAASFPQAQPTLSIVNATQDPAPLDTFDFDTIMPDVAKSQGMPESWIASDDKMAA